MECYRKGGCGLHEMLPCNEYPANKPSYLSPKPIRSSLGKSEIPAKHISKKELPMYASASSIDYCGPMFPAGIAAVVDRVEDGFVYLNIEGQLRCYTRRELNDYFKEA